MFPPNFPRPPLPYPPFPLPAPNPAEHREKIALQILLTLLADFPAAEQISVERVVKLAFKLADEFILTSQETANTKPTPLGDE